MQRVNEWRSIGVPTQLEPKMITAQKLGLSLPKCKDPAGWAPALAAAAQAYDINTKMRFASFLAQIAHESGNLNTLEENLNYSAKRLMAVWPKRFPTLASATPYANNPKALANHVYALRMGNGAASSGDGYKYRGRGVLQLTGRSNYKSAGVALGLDLINSPDLLLSQQTAAQSAAWFWRSRGLNELADDKTDDNDLEDFTTITVRINGGKLGLHERLALYNHIASII
jgi:putative chitinase